LYGPLLLRATATGRPRVLRFRFVVVVVDVVDVVVATILQRTK